MASARSSLSGSALSKFRGSKGSADCGGCEDEQALSDSAITNRAMSALSLGIEAI